MSKKTKHSLLLLLAALIWGLAFVSQSKGMDYMKPLTFNGVRSLIGAFSLLLFILVTGRYGEFYTSDAGYQSGHRP